MKTVSENRAFGGVQGVYSHASPETGCTMRFGLFLPPQAKDGLVPVLYWLSGLTCTEENFIVKAGAQRVAAELGLAIVAPDTSPRGVGLIEYAEVISRSRAIWLKSTKTRSPRSSFHQAAVRMSPRRRSNSRAAATAAERTS